VLHEKPHETPSQVALALGGAAGQGLQAGPQVERLELDTHWEPQA